MQREHLDAFEVVGEALVGGAPILLLCDHASNRIPAEFGSLGVPQEDLQRHIAYDPGAAPLVRALAARLGAPAILTSFSRLLVDCNRGTDDPTLVMRLSDGTVIPGNRHVTESDIADRIARFHDPYHRAVAGAIEQALQNGIAPVLVSVHTYTPVWRGEASPWHAGILWDRDDRLAHLLIDGLRGEPDLIVGDNEPYRGWLKNDCLCRHGTARGLAHALIEVRNDLLASDRCVAQWCDRIAVVFERALADPATRAALAAVRTYGSRTDGD